jgi:hypothetical protein
MSFSHLLARLGDLKIEHLQLDLRTTDALRRRGATNITLLVAELGRERYPTKEGLTAIAALERLSAVCGPRDVDWPTYWAGNDHQFNHRFLTCPELEEISPENPVCGIDKSNFGNAGAMLQRAGYTTLGCLAKGLRDGLPEVPGMGAKKWSELFETIIGLIRDIREGRVSTELLSARHPLDGRAPVETVETSPWSNLGDRVRALHLGVLHLGPKTSALETHGIRTVGQAADTFASLLSLSGIGRATVTLLAARLDLLAASQTETGDIDWERYCHGSGIPLLPVAGDPVDGAAFVAGLSTVIEEIGQKLDDSVLKLIIDRRLSRLPHLRATLEDVGSADGVGLTRERVRQIESRFLKWMVAALLDDDYSNLDVHFRPSFANFWRLAADRFSGTDEIANSALLDGLAEVWQVEAALLKDHFPFIITIMTGDVPTGRSLGDGVRLGKELLNLPPSAALLPMRRLQIGRAVRTLEAHGIETLGNFVAAVRSGSISRSSGKHFRSALDHLSSLEGILDGEGGIDWDAYLARTNVISLPSGGSTNPAAFLRSLVPTLTKLLEHGCPTARAPLIFAHRTSRPVEARPTMEEMAKELKTHGPVIKKEETELLIFLNEVLIGGNLAIAGVHINDDFLAMWKDVADRFEAAQGDVAKFSIDLEADWRVDRQCVDDAVPTVVAVLTGYPYKRLGRYTKMQAPTRTAPISLPSVVHDEQDLPVRIVLRGFRRQH